MVLVAIMMVIVMMKMWIVLNLVTMAMKTAIRKMREGPPGLLQCSHRPPGRSPASKEPGPGAAADH